ncbi:hypothetical protein [Geminicoccus flavidas]|uniref:hypothetical protein n=1 Tax=Geminicoccus flavidas TaxID=2506407 RepID=UPI00135AF731|nr:hypothetical protein [Geminicoccus flavidas]
MTDILHLREVTPAQYPEAFLRALNEPHQLWDTAFRTHISPSDQHLLICMYFCSQYGVQISELSQIFKAIHSCICKTYMIKLHFDDYENSLRTLENGFINIRGKTVDFINPSLRDYLRNYLGNFDLLTDLASAAPRADWASSIWKHAKDRKPSETELAKLAASFIQIGRKFSKLPYLRPLDGKENYYQQDDLLFSNRLDLLFEWYKLTHLNDFVDAIIDVARSVRHHLVVWRDGETLIRYIIDLSEGELVDFPQSENLVAQLRMCIINMLDHSAPLEDLNRICDAASGYEDFLGDEVMDTIRTCIVSSVNEIEYLVESVESVSELEELTEAIDKLSSEFSISGGSLSRARKAIGARIEEIEADTSDLEQPKLLDSRGEPKEEFNDIALSRLFASLVNRRS